MGKINTSRVALGGLVAGVIFFVGDAVVNGAILKSQWSDALRVVGLSADDAFRNPIYFASHDLLKGLFAIWIYSAIRARLGAEGPPRIPPDQTATWDGSILLWRPVPKVGQHSTGVDTVAACFVPCAGSAARLTARSLH